MGRPNGVAHLRSGLSLREQRLDALNAQGWHVEGGFTAHLRDALRKAGHDADGLPGYKFKPSAFRVLPGEVRTIHFVYRDGRLDAGTVRQYLQLDGVLRRVAWGFQPFVLHVEGERLLPLDIEAHRATPGFR